MGGILREMRTVFTASAGGLMSTVKSVRRGLQSVTRTSQQTARESSRSFSQMNDSITEVNDTIDSLNDRRALDDLNKALKDSRKQFEQTSSTVNDLEHEFEALGETNSFNKINNSLHRVQQEMSRTGTISQRSLSMIERELDSIDDVLDNLGDGGAFDEIRDSIKGAERQFHSLKRAADDVDFERKFKQLPEHLKGFGREINTTSREIRRMTTQGTRSLGEMADAAVKSSVAMSKITSVTKTGKAAIKTIQELSDATKETQLAILGLNRDGTVKISTEETTRRLAQFKDELHQSKRELEALRDAGDFGSYEAGMRVVEQKLRDVDRAMMAASRGGRAYTAMITELGVNTSDAANQAAIQMEAYKDRFIRSIDMMNAKSNQSKKMMDILPEVSHIQRVDKFFLGIGNRLEDMGKKGTAANIAISMLGRDASMKDLNDRIMLINQGLMRMNQVAIGVGIALAGFTVAMFNAAKGPEMADVFEQRGQLLLDYQKAVEDRTQEIVDTWGLFEKAEIEKTKPETLMKNLQGQVDVMKNWQKNIDSLAKRGVSEGLIESLRKMGPEAAGQIQALTKMSDSELNKYVALWKEKHALARKEALTELEGLQKETSAKIKELENSLTPLGISLEKAKSTWAQALQPFVETWGWVASKVVDAATEVGNFVNKLNELNPSISASAGMFMYLFTAMSLILSPMAIGIGRAKGMQAAFSATFMIIKPFVLGLLRIAGAASIVAGGAVLIGGAFIKLWKNSENLRAAVMSLWRTLKEAGATIAAPFIKAFQMIGKEVAVLLNKMVGSDAKNMASFWQSLGDKIAVGINKISDAIQPVAEIIASVVDAFVDWEGFIPVIAGVASAFAAFEIIKKVRDWWITLNLVMLYSADYLKKVRLAIMLMFNPLGRAMVLTQLWTKAQAALNLMMSLNPIGLIIAAIVGLGVALFVAYKKSETFRNFVDKLFAAFRTGASAVWSFIKKYWPEILATITGPVGWAVYAVVKYWDQLKSATITAFNAVISFFKQWGPLLLAALGGPIGLAVYAVVKNWDTIKSATTKAFNAVIDFFKQWGPLMLAALGGPLGLAVYAVAKNWDAIKNATITVFNTVKKFISDVLNGVKLLTSIVVSAMVEDVRNQWNEFKSMTTNAFNAVKKFFSDVWDGIKLIFTVVADAIVNDVRNQWNSFKSMTTTTFNAVKSFLSSVWDAIKSVISNAASTTWNNVKSQWNSLKSGTTNIFNAVKKFLSDVWNAIKSTIQKAANDVYNRVKTAWNNLKNNTTTVFNAIKSFLTGLWNGIKNTVSKLANQAKDGVVNAWDSLKNRTTEMFNNIKSKVTSVFDDIVGAAKKLPGRIGDGIKAMASKVKNGVEAIGKKLAGGLEAVVNTITQKGINVVLTKIGVDEKNQIPVLKIPGYKRGTKGHPEDGPAYVGDGGEEELVRLPNGSTYLSPNKTTLIPNMPKGTEVFNGKQTKRILDAAVPKYETGNTTQVSAKKMEKSAEESAHKALHETKKASGKAKDVIGDVWSYVEDPKKLMTKVFDSLNLKMPDVSGMMGQLAKSGVSKIKNGAVDFIKSKMDEFMPSFGADGDSGTPGPGSGYGGMRTYVEAWYNKVKDKFGPTHFMGGYANRNMVGGSSKSMHAYGRAFDIGGSKGTMGKIAEYLRTAASNLQYVIYNHRIAGPGKGKGWRPYGGGGKNPHTDHVHADFHPPAGEGGGGYSGKVSGKLSNWIDQAMKMRGVSGSEWKNGLGWIINKESTGNPRAVGAMTSDGTAKGLMQLKHFNYKGDPFNPVNNIYWGIKYIKDRYKSIGGALKWWRSHNWYANGTKNAAGGPSVLGDGGKREPFLLPNGLMGLSPAISTLFQDLPKGTVVWKSIQDFLNQLNTSSVNSILGNQMPSVDLSGISSITPTNTTTINNHTLKDIQDALRVDVIMGDVVMDGRKVAHVTEPYIKKSLVKDIQKDGYKRGRK